LFAQREHLEDLLDLFGGEYLSRTWPWYAGREEGLSRIQVDYPVLKGKA
jgi:hypothetical protein